MPLLFLLTIILGFSATSTRAADVIIAVVEYGEILSAEDLSGFDRVNLKALSGEDRVRGGSGAVKGGRVLLFHESPLIKGRAKLSTFVGGNGAEIQYAYDGSNIKVSVVVEEGMTGPIKKTSRREYKGAGPVAAGRPTILRVAQSSSTNSRSGKSGYRKTEYERTRVLLVQIGR